MMNNSQGASSFFSGLSTLLGRPHPLLHNLSDTTLKYGFSWYVTDVASYGSIYGTLLTVAVLFFWIYYSAIVFILGGEIAQVWTMRRALRATRVGALFRHEEG